MISNDVENKKTIRNYLGEVGWAVFGFVLALVLLFGGMGLSSEFAELFGVGGDSYFAGLFGLFALVILLPLGYLIYKVLRDRKKLILAKFFWWTFVILDSLLILMGLFYLSL